MNPNIARIRALDKERRAKVKPFIAELAELDSPDDRRERELRGAIAAANGAYVAQINEARNAGETQLGRVLRSIKLKPEQLAEVPLVVEEYRGRSPQEQRQLLAAIGADLDADDVQAAAVKMRAAQALNIPVGSVAPRMAKAHPTLSAAGNELDVLNGVADAAIAETTRELAHAGVGSASHAIAAKSFAASMHLRPDVAFVDQLDPDYAGLTVRQHGFPMEPFHERPNRELEEQRKTVSRLAGAVPPSIAETERRYTERAMEVDHAVDQ